jgi:CRISPR/Cas system-associated endonuclease/helicase Cas3
VEAGVNLSFRTGFRELGSLASLLQVSGRVNREGEYEYAEVWTFSLANSSRVNANPSVKDAAEVLRSYFQRDAVISQELCTEAISDEIKLRGVSKQYRELLQNEHDLGFSTIEKTFKIIDVDTRLAVTDPVFAEDIKKFKIDWRELQRASVQIHSYKLQTLKIPEILDGIFLWDLGYDDFLGYMAGVLFQNSPSNHII